MKLLIFACLVTTLATTAASAISGSDSTYAQFVNRTTSFTKVIKTDDIETREPIYTTPTVVMIGKGNGDILRCLKEDLDECEVFFKSGHIVRSLAVTGEYLYVGLSVGEVLRCELYIKESCKTLHKHGSDVRALVVAGGYLFTGLYNGSILRCDLILFNSCQKLHTLGNYVYSVTQFREYIYVGLSNGQMIRCSMRVDDSFMPVQNMTSGIMGYSNIGNSFYAITHDGYLWNCSEKSDVVTNVCESGRKINYEKPTAVAQFSGMLYVLNAEGLHVCKRANDTSCLTYRHHKDSLCMAFAFGTYQMQSRYKNEETACTWQSNPKCPPYVTYYDVQERNMLEVSVIDGKLYNAQGLLQGLEEADCGWALLDCALAPSGVAMDGR